MCLTSDWRITAEAGMCKLALKPLKFIIMYPLIIILKLKIQNSYANTKLSWMLGHQE